MRELDLDCKPQPGDWALLAAERQRTIVLGVAENGDVITAGAPAEPIAPERLYWLPTEKQLFQLILGRGIEFLTVEAARDGCKCFGWTDRDAWKSAAQETAWSRGDTPLEALMFLLIKLLT